LRSDAGGHASAAPIYPPYFPVSICGIGTDTWGELMLFIRNHDDHVTSPRFSRLERISWHFITVGA